MTNEVGKSVSKAVSIKPLVFYDMPGKLIVLKAEYSGNFKREGEICCCVSYYSSVSFV